MEQIKESLTKILIVVQTVLILGLLRIYITEDTMTYGVELTTGSMKTEISDNSKFLEDRTRGTAQDRTKSLEKMKLNIPNDTSVLTRRSGQKSAEYSDGDEKIKEQELVMKERLSHIREKCREYMQSSYWQNLRLGGKVWTYEPEQIHYCVIPKVGCTFWKRILRFLGNEYPQDMGVQRPSDIERGFVHYGGLSHIRQSSIQNPIARMLMTKGKSFMFTRDPYSRLWSAYIDKFLLPDFWRSDAKAVVKKIRPDATEYERECANDVTFHEFLAFINLTYKYGLNEHWDKMHRLCSPCHVQYDVIGKQESFGTDANFILTKFNLDYLKENTTKLDMVHEEITTLTKYNFNLESAIKKKCFDKFVVGKRLWEAFQLNGYIDRVTEFPEAELRKSDFINNTAETFMSYVFQAIDNQTKRGVNIKSQKRTMMLEAYRDIPKNLLDAIAKFYEYDFEIFGYKKDLFS